MSRTKYTFEIIQEEALKYKSRGEFQRLNIKLYRAAYDRGILDQICSHMPKHVNMSGENNPTFKWSDQKLQAEALKYQTKKDFLKNNRSAYFTAQKKKILNEICSHMTALIRADWTHEELQKEALNYNTRGDFYKNHSAAYGAAKRRRILDEICKHMKLSCGISLPEKNLFDSIKAIYPKTQKLRDSKVKIEGKPYIKGFDLDIYIPELRLGIEFDGTYHHSILGMKRSRPWWPEEDLKIYHELKDSWFKSKNIKVIHIKEEDWIKNKQACIDKCLEFLNYSKEMAA